MPGSKERLYESRIWIISQVISDLYGYYAKHMMSNRKDSQSTSFQRATFIYKTLFTAVTSEPEGWVQIYFMCVIWVIWLFIQGIVGILTMICWYIQIFIYLLFTAPWSAWSLFTTCLIFRDSSNYVISDITSMSVGLVPTVPFHEIIDFCILLYRFVELFSIVGVHLCNKLFGLICFNYKWQS